LQNVGVAETTGLDVDLSPTVTHVISKHLIYKTEQNANNKITDPSHKNPVNLLSFDSVMRASLRVRRRIRQCSVAARLSRRRAGDSTTSKSHDGIRHSAELKHKHRRDSHDQP